MQTLGCRRRSPAAAAAAALHPIPVLQGVGVQEVLRALAEAQRSTEKAGRQALAALLLRLFYFEELPPEAVVQLMPLFQVGGCWCRLVRVLVCMLLAVLHADRVPPCCPDEQRCSCGWHAAGPTLHVCPPASRPVALAGTGQGRAHAAQPVSHRGSVRQPRQRGHADALRPRPA